MAIFSAQFLDQYLNSFNHLNIVDFQKKKKTLQLWVWSLQSGKIDTEKEISIKSTFVNDFFGEILGYTFKNSNKWHLQQELKSVNDGSRSDAAFGYFGLTDQGISGEVQMVAEFKDGTTSLDHIQKNRSVKISAIDQAFLYAAKQPGQCNWVVVCNVREIRFYHYSTQTEFQQYLLEDLLDEKKLLELIFLFHAEHILKRNHSSRTEKLYKLAKGNIEVSNRANTHIVDELYDVMKKFEGLSFVDPVYLTNLYPFNVLKQKVWHYDQGVMSTTNPRIFHLLNGIKVKNKTITISPELETELSKEKVGEPLKKLDYIFNKLNKCLIFQLTAVEDLEVVKANKHSVLGFSLNHDNGFSKEYGIWRNINVFKEVNCKCVCCLYRELDLRALMDKLKSYSPEEIDLEYAFGRYLLHAHTDNKTYHALAKLEKQYQGSDNNIASYFIAKINLRNLSGEVDSSGEVGKAIKTRLQTLDLDAVIAYEVDLFAPPELRAYLVEMKASVLIERLVYSAADSKERTKEIMEYNLRGDHIIASDQLISLNYQRAILNLYNEADFIMIDHLGKVSNIHQDIFQAYVYSFQTPGFGLEEFDENMLSDAIMNIRPSALEKMLSPIDEMNVSAKTRASMLTKARNLLNSFFSESFGRMVENPDMQAQLLDVFSYFPLYEIFQSTFIILCKIGCKPVDIQKIAPSIKNFLISSPDYPDQNMKSLSQLIESNGKGFTTDQFLEILKVIIPALKIHNHQHDNIFNAICKAWRNSFPEEKIRESKLIHLAAVNHMGGSNSDYGRLVNLFHITSPDLQGIILNELKRFLSASFNTELYQDLVHSKVLRYDEDNYFAMYVAEQQRHNTPDGYFHQDRKKFFNPAIYNLAVIVHRFNIPNDDAALQGLNGLTPFQTWLLYPESFDYNKFEVKWLKNVQGKYLISKLKNIAMISLALERHLQNNYEPKLAELYFNLSPKVQSDAQ